MAPKKTRNRFDATTKKKAVEEISNGATLKEVAAKVGANPNTVANWVNADKKDTGSSAKTKANVSDSSKDARIIELEKQVKSLEKAVIALAKNAA